MKYSMVFAIFIVTALPQRPALAQSVTEGSDFAYPEMKHMAFTIGEWRFDGRYPKPDGTFGQLTYISRVNHAMGGKAFQDNFGEIRANGEMDTTGITMRTFDPQTRKWRMLWFSASLDFITQFEGEYIDGEFHFDGKGTQRGRPFLERITFSNITENSYEWKMDRSWDDGKTWIPNFFAYKATRIK